MTIDAPLIDRAKIFGNASRALGQISPDGRWLSWVAPLDRCEKTQMQIPHP